MVSMWRTWRAVRVPPARAVVRSPAGRPWAGIIPWNCSFSQGFIRVSEKLSGFDDNYQVTILGTVAASGIPRAAPQKHKEFQWFLKGALVDPAGAPRPTSHQGWTFGGSHGRIVHFHKVFKGFLNKGQYLTIRVSAPSCGPWPLRLENF